MRCRGPLTTTAAAAFLLSCLLLAAAGRLAAQPVRFGISPTDLELAPEPGRTATGTLLVLNHSAQRVRFRVQVQDIFLRPGGEMDVLPPRSMAWSVAAAARVAPSEFELDGGTAMRVRVSVTLPADARGGRYGAVVVWPTPVLQTGGARGTVSIVIPKLAARLLVPVRGTEVARGAITGMLVAPRGGGRGLEAKIVFRNTGNVHLRAAGELSILTAEGRPVARLPIARALVLPGTVREFRIASVGPALEPGAYVARAVIDYGGDALVSGELTFTVRR